MSTSRNPHDVLHRLWRWLRARDRSLYAHFIALYVIGVVVKLAVVPLLPDALHAGIDRYARDALMQQKTSQLLAKDDPVIASPRFVFLDIDEETCSQWQSDNTEPKSNTKQTIGCTLSSLTPRGKLAELVDAIFRARGAPPKLVVIDIDLAPVADLDKSRDGDLCASVAALATVVPVIVVRPVVVNLDLTKPRIEGHRSIFDEARHEPCAPASSGPGNAQNPPKPLAGMKPLSGIWFASPLIQTDLDGVVRQVRTTDPIWMAPDTGQSTSTAKLGSIGLLGGTILDDETDANLLHCLFPGSDALTSSTCDEERIPERAKRALYDPIRDLARTRTQILFSVPSDDRWQQDAGQVLCHVSMAAATEGSDKKTMQLPDLAGCGARAKLHGAVVMIGGSYRASGDLHRTPIDSAPVPGAMIHVNAIRAFSEQLSRDTKDDHAPWIIAAPGGWVGDLFDYLILIPLAALFGVGFHAVAKWGSRGMDGPRQALVDMVVSLVGFAVQVAAVFFAAIYFGRLQFIGGEAVETLTPPLAVAIEGLSNALHALRHLIEELIDAGHAALFGRRPPTPTPGHHVYHVGEDGTVQTQVISVRVEVEGNQQETRPLR